MEHEYSDEELLAYLEDSLPTEALADLEILLRTPDQTSLQNRLQNLINARDAGTHTIGEIWKRHHVSCPTREDLGRYILQAMSDAESKFIQLHIEVTLCEVCQSNLDDLLLATNQSNQAAIISRRTKYFQSSVGRIKKP